jgi:hypothetical protein
MKLQYVHSPIVDLGIPNSTGLRQLLAGERDPHRLKRSAGVARR